VALGQPPEGRTYTLSSVGVLRVPTLRLWYWKVFIVLSCVAYFFIPPVTMGYLARLHESAELKP
jgi:hypothetical protein